jgi:hypothetical protein
MARRAHSDSETPLLANLPSSLGSPLDHHLVDEDLEQVNYGSLGAFDSIQHQAIPIPAGRQRNDPSVPPHRKDASYPNLQGPVDVVRTWVVFSSFCPLGGYSLSGSLTRTHAHMCMHRSL